MKNVKLLSAILFLLFFSMLAGCSENANKDSSLEQLTIQDEQPSKPAQIQEKENYKVTFVELGSVRCIPCQEMQPIMKSIEEKFPNEVKVVFYDVWTDEGKSYAEKYHINLIPTQVFLDKDGKEFFRHEGFFAEEEIIKVLRSEGVI